MLEPAAPVAVHDALLSQIPFAHDQIGMQVAFIVSGKMPTVPLMVRCRDGCLHPLAVFTSYIVIGVGLDIFSREDVQHRGLALIVQRNHRRHTRPPPLRIPDLTPGSGGFNIYGRLQDLAVFILNHVRPKIDLHIGEIVFPIIAYGFLVSRVIQSLGVAGFHIVIIDEHHVQMLAISARDFRLRGRPFRMVVQIHVGDIVVGPRPTPAVVIADAVRPRTGVTVRW